jgi:hypothetical protein
MSEKGKTLRTCSKGHPMDPSWKICPYCGEVIAAVSPELKKTVREGVSRELKKTVKEDVALEKEKEKEAADRKTKILREKPAELRAVAWLIGVDKPVRATVYQIIKDKTLVGNALECDIQVNDEFASGRHCSIHFEKDKYFITDLDSANGTFVNERKVTKKGLTDGDKIKIGERSYVFKCHVF